MITSALNMVLILEIACGILLAKVILALFHWIVRKVNQQAAEEKYVNMLATQMKLDREGDAEWLRSTPKKH